jgi:hypothetical protein
MSDANLLSNEIIFGYLRDFSVKPKTRAILGVIQNKSVKHIAKTFNKAKIKANSLA